MNTNRLWCRAQSKPDRTGTQRHTAESCKTPQQQDNTPRPCTNRTCRGVCFVFCSQRLYVQSAHRVRRITDDSSTLGCCCCCCWTCCYCCNTLLQTHMSGTPLGCVHICTRGVTAAPAVSWVVGLGIVMVMAAAVAVV